MGARLKLGYGASDGLLHRSLQREDSWSNGSRMPQSVVVDVSLLPGCVDPDSLCAYSRRCTDLLLCNDGYALQTPGCNSLRRGLCSRFNGGYFFWLEIVSQPVL